MQLRPFEEGKFYLKDATDGCIGFYARAGSSAGELSEGSLASLTCLTGLWLFIR